MFQNANKLKKQNIFINNDFSKTTLDLRKDLMVRVKRLKELQSFHNILRLFDVFPKFSFNHK